MNKSILFVGPPACGKTSKLKKIIELYPEAPFFSGELSQEDIDGIIQAKPEVVIVDEIDSEECIAAIDKLTTANRWFYAATNHTDLELSKYHYITVIHQS